MYKMHKKYFTKTSLYVIIYSRDRIVVYFLNILATGGTV